MKSHKITASWTLKPKQWEFKIIEKKNYLNRILPKYFMTTQTHKSNQNLKNPELLIKTQFQKIRKIHKKNKRYNTQREHKQAKTERS